MYKRLLTIKTLLRVVILSFVVFSMFKSCAKAYTWEDIDEFNNQLLDNSSVNQITKNYIGVYNSNKQKFKNFLANNNLDIEDFTGVTFTGNSTTRVDVHFQRNTTEITKTSTSISASHCYNLSISRNSGAVYLSNADYSIIMWSQSNPELYWGLTNGTYNQSFESNQYFDNYYTPPSTFNFNFYDTSVSATVPNGETAYCVFLDPIQNYQKIGYIENFEEHKNTQIQIFAQNYRDPENVLVNSIGESNFILNESGELLVNTNTMWTALVYEIVGIDNGPSGDFLNGENFIAYYYIGAGSNVSGDPLFNGYDADYDNNQFFLWKLIGNIGDGSGDSGSGILGGIGSLFIPSSDFFLNYFNSLNNWLTAHLGFIYTPFEIVINLFNRILTIDYSNPHVEIGPYTLPLNDDYELIPKIIYNFNDLLLNQEFKDVYDIYLIIVDGLIYTGFLYLCYCKYEEIIGGNKQ